MKKINLLVTGGAGFIGSNFIRHILKKYKNVRVVNFDKLTYSGNLDNLKDINGDRRYRFVKGDIANKKIIDQVFKNHKPDYVINFAAESITENTYIPIHSSLGIDTITFKDFWERQQKRHKIIKNKKGEAIFFTNKYIKVLSFLNGGQWMPLRAITRHWYKGKVVRLRQKFGIIEATPNHSIYASNLELTTPLKNPELLVLRNINNLNQKYQKISKDWVTFIAAYVSEGSTTFNKANGGYIIEISQNDKKWLEKIGECVTKEWGLKYNIALNKHSNTYRLQISNKKLFEFLRSNCGSYANEKFFPYIIFNLEHDLKKVFWQVLMEGDGTHDNRYTTVSYKLANQIGLLLVLLGSKFTIYERKFSKKEWNTAYEFKIDKESHYGLSQKNIEFVNYDGWVYDLEVDKTHNFVCGLGNIVCHNTHVDRSIHVGAEEFINTNVLGVFNILESVKKYGAKKYLQISTDEVYGTLSLNKKGFFTERSQYSPNVPYSATKAGGDMLCNAYFHTWHVPVVVTHCSNNYGPYQYPEKLIPFFVLRMIEGKKLPIYGDGKNVRDWIHVLDHCRALEMCLFKGRPGEIYNIGADNEMDNLKISGLILDYFGKDRSWLEFVPDRPGHDRRYAIDASKIKRELGWKSKYHFKKAFADTIKWYLDNPVWIERVRRRTGVFNPHIDLWKGHKLKTLNPNI